MDSITLDSSPRNGDGYNVVPPLISEPRLRGYRPTVWGAQWWNTIIDGKPFFTLWDVERMRRDPMVQFCLRVLRSPLYQIKIVVKADSPKVRHYVEEQYRKIWLGCLTKILRCFEWGFSTGESCYEYKSGYAIFKDLIETHPLDTRALIWDSGTHMGRVAGICVHQQSIGLHANTRQYIYGHHAFWFAGEAEFNQLYGRPRLAGMYEPWLEKRGRNGAVDSRRLWHRAFAFRGPRIWYPVGETDMGVPGNPNLRDNQDIGRELVEKAENGGVMALPNTPHSELQGEKAWQIEDAAAQQDVPGLRDYPKDLDSEIQYGAGIPPEVVRAAETGSGWSGRSIPALVFFASEDEVAKLALAAVDVQQVRPLVDLNFGKSARYTVEHESLAALVAKDSKEGGKLVGGDGSTEKGRSQSQGVDVPNQPEGETSPVDMSHLSPELRRRVRELAEAEYPVDLADDKGRWITIGARRSDSGKKRGGSPVFVKDGRIVKGHSSLEGKKISNLKEEAEKKSRRGENKSSKDYEIAKHLKAARKAGIHPEHVHALASDIHAHANAAIDEHNEILKHSREAAEKIHARRGAGSLQGIQARAARGNLDAAGIPYFDDVAQQTAAAFPGAFGNDPDNELFERLIEGNRERYREEEAYRQALETLMEEHERHSHGRRASGDDDFNFGANRRKDLSWDHYEGPHGGTGWKNAKTGEIRYQDEQPDDGGEKAEQTGFAAIAEHIPEAERKRAHKFFGRFADVAMGIATDLAIKLHDAAPSLLDTASDYSKIFYAAGAGKAVSDPFHEHFGIGPNTVAVIASHVITRAAAFIKSKLNKPKADMALADGADAAEAIVHIFTELAKALPGLPVPKIEDVQKWLAGRGKNDS